MKFRVLHYDTLQSTNNLALKLAPEGAEEGTVIQAEYQTRGRGRFHRRWRSPRNKGLLFSLILRPRMKPSSASMLTHIAALSVAEVLRRNCRIPATLKRPNDVLVRGRKVAGILTESRGNGSQMQYAVVGIGLNVNTAPKDLVRRATSLYRETGRKFEMRALLKSILNDFRRRYREINHRSGST